jgi:hypothetical protein
MRTRRFLRHLLVLLGSLAAGAPSFALGAADVPNLKPGVVLAVGEGLKDEQFREITITHVNSVRADGAVWYQIDGTTLGGQEVVFYADFAASPPKIELAFKKLSLRKLVDRPRKFLDAVEEDNKGELTLDDTVFQFTDAESDEGRFEPDGDQARGFDFNYLVFASKKEPGTSIQVMRWSEEKFDTYLVKLLQAKDLKIK